MGRAVGGLHFGEEGQGPGAHHLGEVRGWIDGDKIVFVGGLVGQKALEPITGRGDVVDHGVKHDLEGVAEAGDIGPPAQGWVHRGVVLDGKAVIRGPRIEGQDVNPGQHPAHLFDQQFAQTLQGGLARFLHLIPIGDEQSVPLAEALPGGRSLCCQTRVAATEGSQSRLDLGQESGGDIGTVDKGQVFLKAAERAGHGISPWDAVMPMVWTQGRRNVGEDASFLSRCIIPHDFSCVRGGESPWNVGVKRALGATSGV